MLAGWYSCQRPTTDWTGILVLFPFSACFLSEAGRYQSALFSFVQVEVFGFLE